MIDKKELRIGNIISASEDENGDSEPCKVFELYGSVLKWGLLSDDHGGNSTNYKYVTPIELTPEWLERFGGYMQDKTPFYCIDMPRNIGEININPDNGMVWLRHFRNENVNLNPASGEKYYVHQLQNLYFALTGEELTINQ